METTSIQARTEAVRSGKVERDKAIICNVLAVYGPLSGLQIAERSGMIGPALTYIEVMRRVSELEDVGKIALVPGRRGPAPSGLQRAGVYQLVNREG